MQAGLTEDQAEIIAWANIGTDKGRTGPMPWQNQSYHFNVNDDAPFRSPGDSRIIRSVEHLTTAIEYMQRANELRELADGLEQNGSNGIERLRNSADGYEADALENLGRGLHALQDTWAHMDEYVEKKWYGYSHPHPDNKLHEGENLADNPRHEPWRKTEVKKDTLEYFQRFMEATGCWH